MALITFVECSRPLKLQKICADVREDVVESSCDVSVSRVMGIITLEQFLVVLQRNLS